MNRARIGWSAGFLLVLAILGTGCDRDKDRIMIGGVAPLTGDGASFGLFARRGFELAVEECNHRGGVLGKPVKLIVVDDKGDPAEGAAAVTRLIQQRKVVGIVGPAMSRVSLAGAPFAQAAGVPLVASAATNARVTQVGDFIFRACPVDSFQGAAGARFAFQDLNARNAACLFELGSEYHQGISEVFRVHFTRLGGRVAAFAGHAPGVRDFRPQLARIIRTAPDLIYAPDFYGDGALIVEQARELGFRGPILGADGWDSPKLMELGGRRMENTFFTTFFSHENPSPRVQAFVKDYSAKFGSLPDGHAAMGYEAAAILLDGISRAGSTEGRAIRDALARTDLQLVTGRVTFDANRNPVKPVVILEVKGGRPAFRAILDPGPTASEQPRSSP